MLLPPAKRALWVYVAAAHVKSSDSGAKRRRGNPLWLPLLYMLPSVRAGTGGGHPCIHLYFTRGDRRPTPVL